MNKLIRNFVFVSALLIGVSTQAATVGLTAVTVNGDKMVNDSVLGVTWADVAIVGSHPSLGSIINSLNQQNYGGYSDWRLPTGYGNTPSQDLCLPGVDHELRCLFINELGNTAGVAVNNYSPFSTLNSSICNPYAAAFNYCQDHNFWSDSISYQSGQLHNTCPPDCIGETRWYFDAASGISRYDYDNTYSGVNYRVLAIRTGLTEVAPVPLPASAWLLLSGLGGLGLMSRKRKA